MANLVESDTENHRGDHAGSERRADPAVIDGPGGLGEPRRRTARPIAHRSVSRTSSRCVGSEAPCRGHHEASPAAASTGRMISTPTGAYDPQRSSLTVDGLTHRTS